MAYLQKTVESSFFQNHVVRHFEAVGKFQLFFDRFEILQMRALRVFVVILNLKKTVCLNLLWQIKAPNLSEIESNH